MTKVTSFFCIQETLPSVPSRDKNKVKDQEKKKDWMNFPLTKWTLQGKIYSWVQKKYMDISNKIHWHKAEKYPQDRENQNVIQERKCLTCLKHYVVLVICV